MPNYSVLQFTVPSISNIIVIDITFKSCPPGFKLSWQAGSSICSHLLTSLNFDGYIPNCNINARTFNRPINSWVGVDNDKPSAFLWSLHCPHGYCNRDNFNVLHYNNNSFVLTTKDFSVILSLCNKNREGVLCSKCSTVNGIKYSVVFGSTECRQCNNWWLWTLVLYAVAGPLLIYLLYVLRKLSIVFLSVLNLGLGFPLCFYNGMTELWKAGLSLLFPLYLLIIVVSIIILSRFYLRFLKE